MTQSDIFTIALKTLGVYAIVTAISSLSYSIGMIYTSINSPQYTPGIFAVFIASLIPFILLLIVSYFLIKKGEIIGNALFPNGQLKQVKTSITPAEFQAIAFSVVGVLVIVLALPKLFQVVTQISYSLRHKSDFMSAHMDQKLVEYSIEVVIQLALGIYLFFGRNALSRIWHKIHPIE